MNTRHMTGQELLNQIFADAYRNSKNGQVRIVQLSVPAREINFAHIIGMPDECIYRNLCLDSGFHAGTDPTGNAIGILQMTPPECTVIAADIALKAGDIDIGFLDRFSGALIITGPLAEVKTAISENVAYFRDALHYTVCPTSEQ